MNSSAARRVATGTAISLLFATSCAILVLFVLRGTLSSGVGETIAAAIVYTVPLLALQAATEQALRRRADAAHFPLDWILYGGAKLTLGLVAAGIGSSLVLLFGIIRDWQDLYLANRLAVIASVIVSCLIRLYGTTRSRLEQRNSQLQEKVEAEQRILRLHEQDFERAREIQEALMPRQLPQIHGCQLFASCQAGCRCRAHAS